VKTLKNNNELKKIIESLSNGNMKIKNNIRVLRAEKNVSQDDVARAIGTTRTTISYIENGRTSSTNVTIVLLLAMYFKKSVEDIFFIDNVLQVEQN